MLIQSIPPQPAYSSAGYIDGHGMHDLLNTKQAAPRVGVTAGTLENWRVLGVGPRFIKTPGKRGKVLYDPVDIEAWKDANRFQSTSQAS